MAEFTFPTYQRDDAKIAKLEAALYAADINALWHVFWNAEGNTNDTVYVELSAPESDLAEIFWSSVSSILSCHDDKTVVAWYAEQGVSF
jgi:hypothetical protein